MPNTASAYKRHRQSEKRNLRNRTVKSEIKTYSKKVLAAVEARDAEAARASYRIVQAKIDKAAKKGVLHKNTASRRKALLARKMGKL